MLIILRMCPVPTPGKSISGKKLVTQIIVINLSGRGDKDVAAIARYKGVEIYE